MPDSERSQAKSALSFKRFLPILLLVAVFVLFFATGANKYVSFDSLRAHQANLTQWVEGHAVLAVIAYIAAYAVTTACSLPGGAVLTTLGGFLFGIVGGSVCAVIGATIGAVLVFLAAKTAFGDILRAKAGPALQRMEAGFRENALSYLLVLRLVPLFPFFLVNLVPAFLGVPLGTYVFATFIGIIPGSLVYASVGNGLGSLLAAGESPDLGLSIFLQPEILGPLIGLIVLAMIPVAYKGYKARKASSR